MLKLLLTTISGKTSASRKRRMSPASVEVLDSGLVPEQVEHRASLLLRSYAENADNKFIPKRPKRSHEPWYLVEQRWFSKLKAGAEPEKWFKCMDPGPLDNSALMDPHNPSKLKRRLVENIDYVLVNEAFWRSIQNWYNISGPEIARYVASDGSVEVYPLVFKVSFTRNTEGQEWEESTEVEMEFSKDTTIEGLYGAIEDRIGLKGLVIKIKFSAYNKLEPLRFDNESAKRTLRELGCGEENWLLVTMPTQTEALTVVRKPAVSSSSSNSAILTTNWTSAFGQPKPSTGNTGDLRGTKKHDGLCGLNNLGNTCYMNAVLQCLSFTSPLRAQLLSGEAQKRVNVDSKFGRKGEVVKEITKLLREMWNGKHRTVAPHGFKQALDGWTTLFQGYHQQDAHELLAFLLDGLHEDTNFGNPTNQPSVVESIFGGNLTSRLTCPECRTESVTNEPFQVLSLELPSETVDEKASGKSVQLFPIIGPSRQVTVGGSKAESVEEIIGRLKAIEPSKNFVLAQVHTKNTSNFRHLEILSQASKVSWENDEERTLAAFEVDEVASNEQVLVHCINRFNGKMLGSPFVVSINNSSTRKQLLEKLVFRLGLDDSTDIQGRFSLKTCPKDRKLTDSAHEFTIDDSRCPASLSYNAVIIVEWSESPPNDVLERFIANLPISMSIDLLKAGEKLDVAAVNSLRSCLDAFCAAETLEGDDLWLCPKCEVKRAAVKQISLGTKMPEVFVLHLKRFNSMGAKLQFPVTYSPLLQVNGADYELYGVIRHHGSTISLGHYDCLVRSGINGKWYQFNDSSVSSVPDVTIGKVTLPAIGWNDPSAYIFFYRKRRVSAAL